MGPGGERPIAFASRTLADSEQKYSQIEKEALALVWGIRRFQQYLLGNHFTLITDHQPLTSILHPEKGLPAVTAARLHRYAVLLWGYFYDICYRSTTLQANADALSRLPLIVECPEPEEKDDGAEYMIRQLEQLPVTVASLQEATSRDPVLAKVLQFVQTGWPLVVQEEILKPPYMDRQLELSTQQGCFMWGIRVVVPTTLLLKILEELHGGHIGVVKMKALARSHVWPDIDREIEGVTSRRKGCREVRQDPKLTPIHPWKFPEGLWRRVHIDFAAPVEGKQLLIVMDAFSQWPEVAVMEDVSTEKLLDELRAIFTRWGIPSQDNGSQFISRTVHQS